ncbi:aspartate--tRNA ligase [Rhodoblastus sphagnicola]|uniref:Aspartate--tRNA ligase n=1 Tax=Rhodoblastus sphagnicola TaxID=333368 RepID=A0A2S6MXW8_9HYPH|nr:aspartate--tRNA ligase [Rhodoblastus sphagnicola]MBB4196636.1 aspartyl-tRNA synthetase [Rhodoblastus sphagnicola]PPQ27198.1 aspartate--tRNA ligase [Rhodoblastus sphagnicola]
MHAYRSHTCGEIRETHIGETTRLSGWCHRIRDFGGVLFIDLRDHYGITQCVVDPDSPAFKLAESFRAEWVVRLDGDVRRRPTMDGKSTDNDELATGRIEVYVRAAEVLGPAGELPLPVFGDQDYPEETRLKYRFLDLRRERIHNNMVLRGRVVDEMRTSMKAAGFNEFQTPILTASSPEGARDFLVPSRIHPGKFYALPQAPQQYKQLLMMAGFDRYFQIAPCFRDEDPRADRLPGEFYQLDLEMSFVTQDDVFAAMEPIITGIFEKFGKGRPVTKTWPRIPYAEALRKYGSDKPDLRNPIVMQEVSEHFRGSGFKIFARLLEQPKNEVWAIPAPTGGQRTFADRMNSWAQGEGQPGLGYILFFDRAKDETSLKENPNASGVGGRGPLANNIGPDRVEAIRIQLGLNAGDAAFFVAGDPEKFARFAGLARTKVGEDLNLVDKERFELAWVVDFPMYEYNEEDKKVDFGHNPFSMPQGGLEALNTQDPLTIKAFQYDIACNGFEIASGGIRNHRPESMVKAFEIAGYGEDTVIERFGGMYRAFQYGAPPHGGMAAGVDRIIMLLAGEQNLREVALFPMNQRAEDILMGAPSPATPKQLRELHMRVNVEAKS